MKYFLYDLILAISAITIIAMTVRIAICESHRPCDTKESRVVEVDGGIEVDPGKLLNGVTVFHSKDVSTDGGAK